MGEALGSPGPLELVGDAPIRKEMELLLGEGLSSAVADQTIEALLFRRADGHVGMEGKSLLMGAALSSFGPRWV